MGRRPLGETVSKASAFPDWRQIGEVFGGTYVFDGHAAWLRGSVSTPEELEKLLDRIDRMALRSFVLRLCLLYTSISRLLPLGLISLAFSMRSSVVSP